MAEKYHNELKAKLCEGNISKVIVQRVLKTNYHKMNFEEFKKEFDDLFKYYKNLESSFVFLWAAAMAYGAYNGFDKWLLFPDRFTCNDGVDYPSLIIMQCGSLFREFPRLAYLKDPPLHSDWDIRSFIQFFTNPENRQFLDFWRKVDNSDAPACPDDTTDIVKLTKELKEKCQEIQEIQEKLQQSAI